MRLRFCGIFLLRVSVDVFERLDEHAAGAAEGVVDFLPILRVGQFHHGADDMARREILPQRAFLPVVTAQKIFVGFALDIGVDIDEGVALQASDNHLHGFRLGDFGCAEDAFIALVQQAQAFLVAAQEALAGEVFHLAPMELLGATDGVVADFAENFDEQDLREFGEGLDVFETLFAQDAESGGEYGDQLVGAARHFPARPSGGIQKAQQCFFGWDFVQFLAVDLQGASVRHVRAAEQDAV